MGPRARCAARGTESAPSHPHSRPRHRLRRPDGDRRRLRSRRAPARIGQRTTHRRRSTTSPTSRRRHSTFSGRAARDLHAHRGWTRAAGRGRIGGQRYPGYGWSASAPGRCSAASRGWCSRSSRSPSFRPLLSSAPAGSTEIGVLPAVSPSGARGKAGAHRVHARRGACRGTSVTADSPADAITATPVRRRGRNHRCERLVP